LLLEFALHIVDKAGPEFPLGTSSSFASTDFATGARAASRSQTKTSPPRPPEATILLYNSEAQKNCKTKNDEAKNTTEKQKRG
jgi:hypothetical protein